MREESIKMECPVCKSSFLSILDEEALKKMAMYCPNCDLKVTLEGINTTTGSAITAYVSNAVINEHIVNMKDKDWKEKMGI